jgi:hypothetical protein
MRKALLSLLLLCGLTSSLFAQQGNTVTVRFAGVPSGTCSAPMFAVNDSNADFYDCKADGTWNKVSGGGGGGTPGTPVSSLQWNSAGTFDGVEGSAVDTNGQVILTAFGATRTPLTITGTTSQSVQILNVNNALAVGEVNSSTLNAAGTGYAAMDTFTITGGGGAGATGTIDTVGAMGVVTGYTITSFGSGYSTTTGAATTTSGMGSGFKVNLLVYALPFCRALNCIGGAGVGDADGFGDHALLDIYDPGNVPPFSFQYGLSFHNGAAPAGAYGDFYLASDAGMYMDSYNGTSGANFGLANSGLYFYNNVAAGALGFFGHPSNKSVAISRFYINSSAGELPATTNFVLSGGWGSTATVDQTFGGDNNPKIQITSSGIGQGANPTITFTYKGGVFSASSNQPVYVCQMSSGTGNIADITHVESTTVLTMTYNGTPVDTKTYIIGCFGAVAG